MEPAGQVTVSLPPTDRPAMEDPATQRIFKFVMTTRSRRLLLFPLLGIAVPAALALQGNRLGGLGAVVLGCWELLFGAQVVSLLWWSPWLRRARRLLTSEPWRPVPAQLVRGGPKSTRCVVRLSAGHAPLLLLIRKAPWPLQQMIGRTGRLWMVGPDAGGTAVVTVDGCNGGLPAKVIGQPPPGEVPVLPAPGATGSPLDDPVIASVVAPRQRVAVPLLGIFLIALGVAAPAVFSRGWYRHVLGVTCIVFGVLLLAGLFSQLRQVRRLRSLLRAGPWTPLPVRLEPWQPRARRFVANVSGQVRLPDGTEAAVTLPKSNLDVFMNATDSGLLWVAGEPVRGRTFAVGVPGYLVLGTARLR